MMQDTLKLVANSDTVQQSIAIIQGIMLVLGALLNIFGRKK